MRELIVYLIRKRLGLKIGEYFRFKNQKSKAIYHFGTDGLLHKYASHNGFWTLELSRVSLNYILSDGCEIRKLSPKEVASYL